MGYSMIPSEFYNREFSVPPDEHTMLRIIRILDDNCDEPTEVSLGEFLESNEGLTEVEIDALSNLKLNHSYGIGVHFGYIAIQRIK